MPSIEELIKAITERAKHRYEIRLPETDEMISPSADIGISAIQLKRINRQNAGWRTVLITAFPFDLDNIQSAFRWAADVRDLLAEPQTADLYMFMLIEGVESEDAARFETNDRFCRKVVLRDCEDIDSFLDRSFLASLTPARVGSDINDPLLASFDSLLKVHSWVKPHIDIWRELLLSNKSEEDVIHSLRTVMFDDKDFE